MLSNVGTAGDIYSINVLPTGNSPAPTLSISTVQLDPAGSAQIALTVNASGLAPGEYQGYVQVSGTANPAIATIPYWFAVPGPDPAGISVLYQDYYDAVRTLSRAAVVFRIVDIAGLPYTGPLTPSVAISAGGASIRGYYRAGNIPGTYAVDIRTGASSIELDISIGGVTQSVFIPVY